MTDSERYKFIKENSVEIIPNDTYWIDKRGQKFKPKNSIIINGTNLTPMELDEAIEYYVKEIHPWR